MRQTSFGEIARECGYLTARQLEQALAVRARDAAGDRLCRPLGLICLELGFMGFEQVQTVFALQHAASRASLPSTARAAAEAEPAAA